MFCLQWRCIMQAILPQRTNIARLFVIAVMAALVHCAPAYAQAPTQTFETLSYSWDEVVPADEADETPDADSASLDRQRLAGDADAVLPSRTPLASFGPFHVIDASTVEMIGTVDNATPQYFAQALARFPDVKILRLLECPGTEDDEANFALARMVRSAGIATHVPAGGSIRSGGVELFLAGATHSADPGAEFGVHSWQDSDGLEAKDVPAQDPVHLRYINYYIAMGMSPQRARAFYAFTNAAAASNDVHYMTPEELRRFGLI
jgi:hypothetical protein